VISMRRHPARSQSGAQPKAALDVESAIAGLKPLIVMKRQEGERMRHVPPAVVEALAKAGMLEMFLARSLGGPELTPMIAFKAIEEISLLDGSIGWCAMIASILSGFASWLPPGVGRAVAGQPADLRLAGSIRPQGRARASEGGYRIEGHWDFASGINHARWLLCPCVLMLANTPMLTPQGTPEVRTFWVPAERAVIKDTWHVMGLRGTGSHDFIVEDVFVNEDYSSCHADPPQQDGLLYNPRLFLTWVWTATVANALGIARGAMNEFIELASHKGTTNSTTLLRDRPLVQTRVAEAEALLGAARAYVLNAVGNVWTLASERHTDLDSAIARARLAITHGMHAAARSVDLVFHAAGTNAVYEKNSLERHFRDIHVALQHGAALPSHIEAAGKALLGLRPTNPGW
jgi:indole-3-acetate monooxygenase